jgi:N-acetylglutamate synthase
MSPSFAMTEFTMSDYAEVIELWRAAEGVGLSAADEPERIASYLARNPGMSFVARANGKVVGAVICGHDGRRGLLHHLAVQKELRGQGIGAALVDQALAGLKAAGIDKCHLFVFRDNQAGRDFWAHKQWKERSDLVVMSINVDPG